MLVGWWVAMVAYYRKLRYGLHHIRIATATSLEAFDPNESLNFWCVGRRGCCLHDVSRARRPTKEDTGSDPVDEGAQVIPHGIIFDLHRWRRQIAVSRLDLFYIGLHIVLRELRVVVKGPWCWSPAESRPSAFLGINVHALHKRCLCRV